MLSPEEIERIVKQYDQAVLTRGGSMIQVGTFGSRPETTRASIVKEIHGKRTEFIATPLDPIAAGSSGVYARRLKVDQIRENCCGIQSRDLNFREPVLVMDNKIYLGVPQNRGRRRLQQSKPEEFDLSLVFDGSKEAIKRLKDLTVKKS